MDVRVSPSQTGQQRWRTRRRQRSEEEEHDRDDETKVEVRGGKLKCDSRGNITNGIVVGGRMMREN